MLVTTLLPTGLKGLVAGGLMAALMSSLASVFNSASTIFTLDIYKKLSPNSTDRQLLNVGRIATGVIVVAGLIWIPVMMRIGGGVMYQYLQNVQSYIAPPVTTVFLLGILWKRVNAPAAITTLMAGLVLLVVRLGSEIYYQADILAGTNPGGMLFGFATINFSHMAIFLFLFSVAVCISVTLMTSPPDYSRIRGLAFGTLTAEDRAAARLSMTPMDMALSVVLVSIVIGILSYFTG
jgi:SSS family solute:Na+ symporter